MNNLALIYKYGQGTEQQTISLGNVGRWIVYTLARGVVKDSKSV